MKNFENLITQLAGRAPYVGLEHMPLIMTELCKAVMEDKTFFISVNLAPHMLEKYGKNHITKADLKYEDVEFSINTLKMGDEFMLPAFTTTDNALKGGKTDTFEVDIYQFFDMLCDNPNVNYAIINPFGKSVIVDKNMANILLDQFE